MVGDPDWAGMLISPRIGPAPRGRRPVGAHQPDGLRCRPWRQAGAGNGCRRPPPAVVIADAAAPACPRMRWRPWWWSRARRTAPDAPGGSGAEPGLGDEAGHHLCGAGICSARPSPGTRRCIWTQRPAGWLRGNVYIQGRVILLVVERLWLLMRRLRGAGHRCHRRRHRARPQCLCPARARCGRF